MGQPIKIQINTLEAVERLIGGDSEIEIEVRNSVVQAFANKHLRIVARELLGTVTDRAIRDGIKEELLETVSVPKGQYGKELVDVLRKPIKDAVPQHIKALIKEETDAAWSQLHKEIDKHFKQLFDYTAESLKPQIADSAIEQLVVQRINKMLAKK